MSDSEIKQIFSSNLRRLLDTYQHSQKDASTALGIASQTFNNWCKGNSIPSIDMIDKIAEYLHCTRSDLIERPSSASWRMSVSIPVFSRVVAGVPIDDMEEIIDREDISSTLAKTGDFFGLRIKGDSMEPCIYGGDTAIVCRQRDVESGQIVIAQIDHNDGICRKLKKSGDLIILIALNSKYDPIFIKSWEGNNHCRILGRVVEIRRKL